MTAIDAVIQLSDLFEATHTEGGIVALAIDADILPYINQTPLAEADGIGLGDRFGAIIDQVREKIARVGGRNDVRKLKEMMKDALTTYVKQTHDALTARDIFHRAIMSGADVMLTVTASVILANVLSKHNAQSAQHLIQVVAGRLSGNQPMEENASGAATGAGAIVGSVAKKKRRKDSIFAEDLQWRDLQDVPEVLDLLREIAEGVVDRKVDDVVVDPTTAELVLAAHQSLSPDRRKRFCHKTISEMIAISDHMVEQGFLQVILEEC